MAFVIEKPNQIRLIKWLLSETLPENWRIYCISLISIVGVASFSAAQAYSTKLIVNDVFGNSTGMTPIMVASVVIAIFAGKSIALYVNAVMSTIFNRSVTARFQKKIFSKSIVQSVDFFSVHSATKVFQTIQYGRAAGTAVVSISSKMLTDILTLIALTYVMISQAPLLSATTMFLLPFVYLIISKLSKSIRNLSQAETAMDGAIYSIGAETFEGIKTVKSFGMEAKSDMRFRNAVDQIQVRLMKIAKITGATVPLMELLGGISLAFFILFAGSQVAQDGFDAGAYTAFVTAFLMAYQPAQRLSGTWVKLQRKLVIVGQMYELLQLEEPSDNKAISGSPQNAFLQISNLTHSYDTKKIALREISLSIEPGQHVAVVGLSGAGKTTLIDLVQGFYSATSGEIALGGVDISTLSPEQKVENIALISQDVFLFDGTIRENICDGNPNATELQIDEAANKAAVMDFAALLPDGLDTQIGPNGSLLSGGQKQRVGIARALIKPAKVFIYDEATSALDGETERRIMQAIRNAEPDSLVLFITHRASTLEWMDKILVLDNGRLVAFDNLRNILKESNHFKGIFAPQYE